MALVPASKKSVSVYRNVNMLMKCIFYSAEDSHIIDENPTKRISAKGGIPEKERPALTDEQVKKLLDAIRGLPPYVFVMLWSVCRTQTRRNSWLKMGLCISG